MERSPSEPYRPRNPSIPFYSSSDDFKQFYEPPYPADLHPERQHAWLVQPGIHSIEVYEAIFRNNLGQNEPLKTYICKAGVLQYGKMTPGTLQLWSPRFDYGACVDRDVCFVMLTSAEQEAFTEWMKRYDTIWWWTTGILTPLGKMFLIRPNPDSRHAPREEEYILRHLGLWGSTFPRTPVPSSVKPIDLARDPWAWRMPDPDAESDTGGRATDLPEGLERIEWDRPLPRPLPPNPVNTSWWVWLSDNAPLISLVMVAISFLISMPGT